MADHARTAFLHAGCRQRQVVNVLGAGEQRDRVVATGAVASLFRSAVCREVLLNRLERRIHGREAMGARLPLGIDLLMAAGRAARRRVAQHRRIDQVPAVRAGIGRSKRDCHGTRRISPGTPTDCTRPAPAISAGCRGHGDSCHDDQQPPASARTRSPPRTNRRTPRETRASSRASCRRAQERQHQVHADQDRRDNAADQVHEIPGRADLRADRCLPGQPQTADDTGRHQARPRSSPRSSPPSPSARTRRGSAGPRTNRTARRTGVRPPCAAAPGTAATDENGAR